MGIWDLLKKEGVDLPENLKDMTPEQLADYFKNADLSTETIKTLTTELEAAKGEAATALSEVAIVKANLDRIEANLPKPPPKDPPDKPSFFHDEDDAFNTRFAEKIGPLAQLTLDTGAQTAKLLAEAKFPREFKRYSDEIDKVMEQDTPAQMVHPQFWENTIMMVRGRHLDELADEKLKGEGDFFVEGAVGGAPPPEPEKDDKVLTNEEKKIAKSMGITEENYLKKKEGMKYVTA